MCFHKRRGRPLPRPQTLSVINAEGPGKAYTQVRGHFHNMEHMASGVPSGSWHHRPLSFGGSEGKSRSQE